MRSRDDLIGKQFAPISPSVALLWLNATYRQFFTLASAG